MAKAFYNYLTEGTTFSFLQDTATAAALGQTAATVGTPRLPHKLKPGRIAIKISTGVYKHPVADESTQATFSMGDSLLGGTIVGFDGEVNNAFSAF